MVARFFGPVPLVSVPRAVLLCLAAVLLAECSSALLRPEQLKEINKHYRGRVWEAGRDIQALYDENDGSAVFKKGDRLRVWIESRGGWVRVKAFSAAEDREQARGQTIVYFFEEDLPRPKDKDADFDYARAAEERLRRELGELLVESKEQPEEKKR